MTYFPEFLTGCFGLERETLRVDADERLAQTPHPFSDNDIGITRDFCENQIELITPVCHSIPAMLDALAALDSRARAVLQANSEKIWLYSNPPHFETEADIPIANFIGEHSNKRSYRDQLQRRYGKRLMLYSGIHFNFSFSETFLHHVHTQEAHAADYQTFRNAFYLRLYKQLRRYSWLLVVLTAASPLYDRSMDEDNAAGILCSPYASMRNSRRGYWNEFIPILEHDSLTHFTDSIQSLVDKGLLFSPSELYLPIRLKPRGANTLENLARGVSHIELRMFDLNPLEPLGIHEQDLAFAHLLILWLAGQPDFTFTPQMQETAVQQHQDASLYDLTDVRIDGKPAVDRAQEILHQMRTYFSDYPETAAVLEHAENRLHNRLCRQITEQIYHKE